MLQTLVTPQAEHQSAIPWDTYPRPQMKRDNWLNLNGLWEFEAEDFKGQILVPYCPESQLSGIGRHFQEGCQLTYRRSFTLPEDFQGGKVLLHIGAADQHLHCEVNGAAIGSHSGGYEQITFDVTAALVPGQNELTLRCSDDLNDLSMPYGKQVKKRGGMWYTPVSGIWQTVWLERVPQNYIESLSITAEDTAVCIDIGRDLPGSVTVAGLGRFPLEKGRVRIAPENPRLWSPEDPWLYEMEITAGEDRVESYFALRTLEIRKVGKYQRLCMNGRPYFFHGLLDQGYWPDGLLTPADPECYADDILAMKRLGFNTLRKHIKVEPAEFYYQCDKLGMVVFQDMVNNGQYSYLRDTILPTILPVSQKLPDKWLGVPEKNRTRFHEGMAATVNRLKNHPCVLYWTIFNEGWGQFAADEAYETLRLLDPTRWIDSTSGWFRQKKTDVDSRHVYFRKVNLTGGDKPLVLSEFGGYSHKVEGHVFNTEKSYGYGSCTDLDALGKAVESLYRDQVLPCVKRGLCAAIYTQVSDVEDEINGLRTYDRRVEKLTPVRMLPIAQALQAAVEQGK